MKAIIDAGMPGLVEWAGESGIQPDPEGYYSVCHIRTSLRKHVYTSK